MGSLYLYKEKRMVVYKACDDSTSFSWSLEYHNNSILFGGVLQTGTRGRMRSALLTPWSVIAPGTWWRETWRLHCKWTLREEKTKTKKNKNKKKDTYWTGVLPVLINITLLTQCVFLYDCGITYSKPWHIKGKNDPT